MMKKRNRTSKPPGTYFGRVTPPQEEPQAGSSGGVSGEGSVIQEMAAPCVSLPLRTSSGTRCGGGKQCDW